MQSPIGTPESSPPGSKRQSQVGQPSGDKGCRNVIGAFVLVLTLCLIVIGIVLVLGSGRVRWEAYKAARHTRTARRRYHTTKGPPQGTKGSSGGTEAPSAKGPAALRRLSYLRGEPDAPTADDDQGTEQLMTLGPDVEVGDDPTNVIRL